MKSAMSRSDRVLAEKAKKSADAVFSPFKQVKDFVFRFVNRPEMQTTLSALERTRDTSFVNLKFLELIKNCLKAV
jgi:hypothetical protein